MAKTLTLHTRIEPEIKEKAEVVLKQLGISTTEAINMFLNQIIMNNGLPFEVKIPNTETLEAIQEIEDMKSGKLPKHPQSIESLFEELKINVDC